jgi:dihydrofolate synthase/folylpolyglutamate synthase
VSNFQAALTRLYGLTGRGRVLGLDRIQAACARFGNPERSFRAVHVAGTNGKGTVSAFLASMLRASGKTVGLYTSPHLCRFAERVRIDGDPITDERLSVLINRVMDEAPELTFFEVTTLVAFLAFQEAGVEVAVLEVGLGGRLDATNVIPPPDVAIITRVAFDHVAELGDSLGKIAAEKAGIIKARSKVVVGRLHPDALEAVEQRVREVGATLLPLGGPEPIPGAPLAYPRLSMVGSNLAVAVTAARALGLEPKQIADGIEQMEWPGRNELLHRSGQELTLLDCAHNPDGAVALAHSLDPSMLGEIESRREIALVFGAIHTKNYRAMLRRLESVAFHRVYVAPPINKAVPPESLAEVLPGEIAADVPSALSRARELVGPRGVVVVTGSTFLVGAARAALLGLPIDPPVDL